MNAGQVLKFLPLGATRCRLLQQRSSAVILTSKVNTLRSLCPCGSTRKSNLKELQNLTLGTASSPSPLLTQSSSLSSSAVLSSLTPHNASLVSPGNKPETSPWELYAGIVLERKPVVTQKKDVLQEKHAKFISQLEYELSKKSDHEMRRDKDQELLEKLKSGDADVGNVRTARDDEDKWNLEAQGFQPGKRETDADLKNDVRSLERALDSHLLLLVEQKLGNGYRWICPHAKLEEGETLRQAAERVMQSALPEVKTKVLGHAPWGFYKYKYPKTTENASHPVGAKVFFYKAQVMSGEMKDIADKTNFRDFVWLKRSEIIDKLQPEYYKKLSECLIDEF